MPVVFYYVVFALFVCTPVASALGLGLLALRVVNREASSTKGVRRIKRVFLATLLVAASGFALAALLGKSLVVK